VNLSQKPCCSSVAALARRWAWITGTSHTQHSNTTSANDCPTAPRLTAVGRPRTRSRGATARFHWRNHGHVIHAHASSFLIDVLGRRSAHELSKVEYRSRSRCFFLRPPPTGWGIMQWWPLSVRLSVCAVPDPKSRTDGRSKLEIGKREAHDMDDQWPHLEVRRSKVKVTRPLNAVTQN